jgi:hypothetical protein
MEVKRRRPDIASPSYTRNLISPESKVDYPTLHDARHDHTYAWVKVVARTESGARYRAPPGKLSARSAKLTRGRPTSSGDH